MRQIAYKGKKAFFHQLYVFNNTCGDSLLVGGHKAGQISVLFAVVELEDGSMILGNISDIKFLDNPFVDCFWSIDEVEDEVKS